MKKLIILVAFLTNCGDVTVDDVNVDASTTTASEAPAEASKWSDEEIEGVSQSCITSVTENPDGDINWISEADRNNLAKVSSYCYCMIGAMSKKGTLDEWKENAAEWTKEFEEKDGVFDTCHANAGIVERTCEEGKICKGMTKDEVKAVLGAPNSLEGATWVYTETTGELDICVDPLGYPAGFDTSCTVSFDRGGLVNSQTDIDANYIDLNNF